MYFGLPEEQQCLCQTHFLLFSPRDGQFGVLVLRWPESPAGPIPVVNPESPVPRCHVRQSKGACGTGSLAKLWGQGHFQSLSGNAD